MSTKADLKIVLYANDLVVAEISDPKLWQQVLAFATSDENHHAPLLAPNQSPTGTHISQNSDATVGMPGHNSPPTTAHSDNGPLSKFAKNLGLEIELLDGAISPSEEAPFLHIDHRTWEAFKRNTPKKGRSAVASIVASATLLALWDQARGINETPLKHAKEILNNLGAEYNNPTRSLNNCDWLQLRGENIRLNPSNFSTAESFARCFIEKSAWDRPHE